MIGKLKGIIDTVDEDHIILDVAGVGYIVFASSKTISQLGAVGEAASFLIETHIREDHFHLYGFPTTQEKKWFKILLNVQGVGAKLALSVLSAYGPQELTQIIAAQDKAMFAKVSGVGPKLATRLTTELKDKVGTISDEFLTSSNVTQLETSAADGTKSDAVSALTNLGITKMDAFIAVNKIANDDMSVEEIIASALREVGK